MAIHAHFELEFFLSRPLAVAPSGVYACPLLECGPMGRELTAAPQETVARDILNLSQEYS